MMWGRTELGLYLPDGYDQSAPDMLNGTVRPPNLGAPDPVGVSLFTGAGGMDLGFTSAGFHVAVATDNDPASAATYLVNMARYGRVRIEGIEKGDIETLNHYLAKDKGRFVDDKLIALDEYVGSGWIANQPDEVRGCEIYYFGDVRQLTGDRILRDLGMGPGEVGVVFGGPPCQGFSHAGKRDVMDPRNSLVFDFARLVLEIQPKAMVMENVPGIISMVTPEGVPVVDALCRILEDGDFGTFDALKKSIVGSAGVGGALKGRTHATQTPEPDDEDAQASLFDLEETPA